MHSTSYLPLGAILCCNRLVPGTGWTCHRPPGPVGAPRIRCAWYGPSPILCDIGTRSESAVGGRGSFAGDVELATRQPLWSSLDLTVH